MIPACLVILTTKTFTCAYLYTNLSPLKLPYSCQPPLQFFHDVHEWVEVLTIHAANNQRTRGDKPISRKHDIRRWLT